MSEKDQTDQSLETAAGKPAAAAGETPAKGGAASREDRLAEALRANLRRRKTAAKARKDD
ncbi:hypothetical protein [Roseibium aggregatum]|uniref:Uncharacterized protein n=1 Tax=Roseibium aggregatum TaxID=187304 RepID=A0A939EBG5_9HYPH|nr:hypothetical protein [Roseibium aggregatum]MBN9669484.1 hypothetical protein [Roseibium aggregatum]